MRVGEELLWPQLLSSFWVYDWKWMLVGKGRGLTGTWKRNEKWEAKSKLPMARFVFPARSFVYKTKRGVTCEADLREKRSEVVGTNAGKLRVAREKESGPEPEIVSPAW
jgi:hypothetical protein